MTTFVALAALAALAPATLAATALAATAAAAGASRPAPEVNDGSPPASWPTLPAVPAHPSAAAMDALGRKLFFDRNLSATHRVACASCHDPAHAYGPPNGRAVQLAGRDGRTPGQRAAPSLRYRQNVPLFTEHYFDEDFDESVDNGPTGGFTWDGRASSPREQARLPLLSPLEMANDDVSEVVSSVRTSAYAAEFMQVFGERIFDDPEGAFDAITRSLEVFEQNPVEFYPYTSKYDAFLRGRVSLSAQELRGLALFNDPAKGNCASCHQSQIGGNGALPAFTDFGFIALAVPRNRQLAMNADPTFYDLGLCGPLRHDLSDHPEYCGRFRTPSLRNVALRKSFFHNGVMHDLREVLRFYAERDLDPAKWYGRAADGSVRQYDDLPAQYRVNVNRDPPFNRGPGEPPALSEAEITDLIAFLNTLTDGWSKP